MIYHGSQPKTLDYVSISGPPQVPENSQASYTAIAHYISGSTEDVTAFSKWSEDSPYVSKNLYPWWDEQSGNADFQFTEVPSNQTAYITISYTYLEITKSAIKQITILDSTSNNPPNLDIKIKYR